MSSTALGSDPASLVDHDPKTVWRSAANDVTPSVTLVAKTPQRSDQFVITAGQGGTGARRAHLEFDDAAPVAFLIPPDARRIVVRFAPRVARTVEVVVDQFSAGSDQVAYSSVEVSSGSGPIVGSTSSSPVVTASSGSGLDAARAARGDLDGWRPDADDTDPTIRLSWPTAREVHVISARAQIGEQPFSAVVRFSDGSSLPLGTVSADRDSQTAFMTRVTTSLTIRASRGRLSLAMLSTETVATRSSSGAVVEPPPSPCGTSLRSDHRLAVLCPTPGTTVNGRFDVSASAAPNAEVRAQAWVPGAREVQDVATATADADGRVSLSINAAALLKGPLNVRLTMGFGSAVSTTTVQVVNDSGISSTAPSTAPTGMHEVFDDEFDGPLSVSRSGESTDWSALKPSADGSTQFGDAPFSDPAQSPEQIRVDPAGALRLRLGPVAPTGRTEGAIVASMSASGTGFSVLDGYFEARILGGPGPGAWPAFWMLSANSASTRNVDVSEVDAVELYGHDGSSACTATHNYRPAEEDQADIKCHPLALPGDDWSLRWHTYGVRITAHEAVFSVDGEEVGRAPRSVASDQPMFFMLNIAAGGGWPVDLSTSSGSSLMYVDWVRAWV